jgi:putative ABC transport system permease protein
MQWNVWFKRRGWERRMDAEFRFHLDSQSNEYIRQGFSPEEAELRARQDFGAVELAKDECRDEKFTAWFDNVLRDFRYAFRSLRKSPGFLASAVVTLALGIGANTAIFQLFDAVRLRTLPVPDPHALTTVQLADRKGWRGGQASDYPALTNPIWQRFRDTQKAFSGVAAWANAGFNLSPGGDTRQARGLLVSGDFFHVLGVRPVLGRVFTAADDHRGCGLPGAVISYGFWQSELGGDASVIGRQLTLNLQSVKVIGVTPAGFTGLEIGSSYDVAVPICSLKVLWSEGNWLDNGTVWWLNVMGRLRPAETVEAANAQLRVTSREIFEATLPANYPRENVKDYLRFKLAALPAGTGVSKLRTQYADPLLLLLATSGFVLLIACANLANLILARATTREHEFALRMAIGASRGRLIRQLMVESVLLALCGATLGVFLSGLLSKLLVSQLGTMGNPLFLNLRPDLRMLAFTTALASLTCMLFGLTPAWRATRIAPANAMKTGGRSLTASRERFGLRQMLVISQVAFSLVLLVGALLFSGTLRNLLAVDAGFQHSGIVITNADFSRSKIPVSRRLELTHDLLQRIRAVPGVTSAAQVTTLPLSGDGTDNRVWKEGSARADGIDSNFNWLGDGYLKTMEIGLLSGRDFNEHDTVSSPKVAIVNQSFAGRLGLGPNPVGAKFRREATPSEPEQVFEIVGLVRDTKYHSLREDFPPIAFLSIDQDAQFGAIPQIVIHTAMALGDVTSAVRSATAQVNPLISVEFHSFETMVQEGLLRERLMATLSSFFGALAVFISAVGLFGVISYLVVQRTSEIGVRMALGARPDSIVALILRQAGMLLAIGIAAGSVVTLGLAGTVKSILFGLKPYDARIVVLAAALLAAVAAAASYLPARRAARVEPIVALREE